VSAETAETVFELALPGARAVFSTRRGGVSEGPYESLNLGLLTDDEPERVMENRRRAVRAARVAPERVAMGWQVHGAELREWDGPPAGRAYAERRAAGDPALPHVDGHLTAARDLALLVTVADCYPVALSDGARTAMLHCGWRPLAGGILERALERFEATPEAAVGPGIGGCCYEVGPEVLAEFADLDGVARGRLLDLRAVISRKLEAAGVTRVQHLDHCTSCRADLYFSHRRDGGVTGRQAGLVVRDGS
jgi:YfiH family protein